MDNGNTEAPTKEIDFEKEFEGTAPSPRDGTEVDAEIEAAEQEKDDQLTAETEAEKRRLDADAEKPLKRWNRAIKHVKLTKGWLFGRVGNPKEENISAILQDILAIHLALTKFKKGDRTLRLWKFCEMIKNGTANGSPQNPQGK